MPDSWPLTPFSSPANQLSNYDCAGRLDGNFSEHSFANAVDILGFKPAGWTKISVERDWGAAGTEPGLEGLFLRTIHKQACDIFTTVL